MRHFSRKFPVGFWAQTVVLLLPLVSCKSKLVGNFNKPSTNNAALAVEENTITETMNPLPQVEAEILGSPEESVNIRTPVELLN